MIRRYGRAIILSVVAVCSLSRIASAQEIEPYQPLATSTPLDATADRLRDKPQRGPHFDSPHEFPADGQVPRGPQMPFPLEKQSRAANPALELAQKLSAVEIYVGIRSSQMDSWRDYTSALIDFLAAPGDPDTKKPQHDYGHPPTAAMATSLPIETIAKEALAKGEKATALLDTLAKLLNTLDGEQIRKLHEADAYLRPARFNPHVAFFSDKIIGPPEGTYPSSDEFAPSLMPDH